MSTDSEYIMLTSAETEYGDKNLLYAQLDLLSMVKRYKSYEALRKQELTLKISLKSKAEEAVVSLNTLSKSLPKATLVSEKQLGSEPGPLLPQKKTASLDEEIDIIKQKLAKLR